MSSSRMYTSIIGLKDIRKKSFFIQIILSLLFIQCLDIFIELCTLNALQHGLRSVSTYRDSMGTL